MLEKAFDAFADCVHNAVRQEKDDSLDGSPKIATVVSGPKPDRIMALNIAKPVAGRTMWPIGGTLIELHQTCSYSLTREGIFLNVRAFAKEP